MNVICHASFSSLSSIIFWSVVHVTCGAHGVGDGGLVKVELNVGDRASHGARPEPQRGFRTDRGACDPGESRGRARLADLHVTEGGRSK
jgi:hypothetical protein